jgi:hypothetical protein
MANGEYPANLTVDYPDRPLDRLSSFFRIITVLPILFILGLLPGNYFYSNSARSHDFLTIISTSYVFLPLILMLLFRKKYPRWWYDWNLALVKFGYRIGAYALLLRDEYPSTEDEQAVHVEIAYPDAASELSRWLPLVKWFLAIPHYIVLFFLAIATVICAIFAWFAILFTGRYPRSLFDFVVGFLRWGLRVTAYSFLLVTDKYPPFRLSE